MLVRKTHTSSADGLDFILSDATVDRYGDSIDPTGWDLRNFLRNPIAQFGHQSSFPIGTWKNLQVKDGALRGRLVMAPKGTSDRIDEIRALIEAGVLKAVSVGFRPIESEPLVKSGGTRYIKSELVECSLVSVPANPNALQVSKMLGVSKETLNMVFKRNNNAIVPTRSRPVTINNKATISQRIAHARALVRADEILKKSEAREKRDRVLGRAKAHLKRLETLKKPRDRFSLGITFRGQKIPDGWYYPGLRKNWWDPES
ncbi:HK97 family phage prohead protease [Bradyrhizobium sp. AUGA SZCCT0283]|uniref:HK97 family phage prohead protease n=1 Tax=Bradyrhizobium sp. AUGA SZCCT0283 TaxID=2807671 RepID=UPI001BAC4FED|nr:HK97 family phage prohead protease [Bradyrhizobium sp. AUGA SZCCT0283]MBR1276108.1 HK97 family phage prohead protease [Bradyrhizobium sp. AUGA SZCCT0283]